MGFMKRVVFGGVCAFFAFNFIFGSTFANNKHAVGGNNFLTNLLDRPTISQNGNKTSLYQELSKIGKEAGLNVKPEEWFTNPNKVLNQANEQLNDVMNEVLREAGIDVQNKWLQMS